MKNKSEYQRKNNIRMTKKTLRLLSKIVEHYEVSEPREALQDMVESIHDDLMDEFADFMLLFKRGKLLTSYEMFNLGFDSYYDSLINSLSEWFEFSRSDITRAVVEFFADRLEITLMPGKAAVVVPGKNPVIKPVEYSPDGIEEIFETHGQVEIQI